MSYLRSTNIGRRLASSGRFGAPYSGLGGELEARRIADILAKLTSQLTTEMNRQYPNLDKIYRIIQEGADVDHMDAEGNTPLLVVARQILKNYQSGRSIRHEVDIFKRLMTLNPDVNIEDLDGTSLFDLIIMTEQPELVDLLLEHEADQELIHLENKGLCKAIVDENRDFVEYILKRLFDDPNEICRGEYDNEYPLHLAVKTGNEEIVKLLLDNNADIDIQDYYNKTALIHAVINEDLSMVRLLLQYDPDLDLEDDIEGWTALTYAQENGLDQIEQALIDAGAEEQEF